VMGSQAKVSFSRASHHRELVLLNTAHGAPLRDGQEESLGRSATELRLAVVLSH
jgi:hypothetical protein